MIDNKLEPVRVRILGGFSVSIGSRAIGHNEWRLKNAAALLKLLALASDHRLDREQIMERLWPRLGKGAASNNLRRTLHAARKALDPANGSRYLASEQGRLALCPGGSLWVDVEAFEEAARTARRERDPAAFRVALGLYAGELLPADRYEEWAEEKRGELRRLYLDLLLELAGAYEDRGEHGLAIETLIRLTTEEPSREEAHAGLMRLHALSGRQAEALRQYEILEQTLARELGAEPNASSRSLREAIGRGTLSSPSADGTIHQEYAAGIGRHNLPAARTSFVGREREVAEVKHAVAMTHLLTLTGAGGSGKTRLALEVCRDLVGAYPDGVWLVELAPLSEGSLAPKAVAEALGVPERQGEPVADTLVEALRERYSLLILDNCEHLVEATARLVDTLLDACPNLRILATSREPLGVAGELNWSVPSLSVPDERASTVEEVEGHASTRLFAARASHKNRNFSVTPENARVVATICRRLDGIPLAVELAAARVGPLSVGQIAHRLDDSLGLLTSGGRTSVPRQRTLRGALDWSYGLLGEKERVLLRGLAVFAGGFTLKAAEEVGGGAAESVLDLLSGLVEKSLVLAESTQGGGLRYRLLEPVRQYALGKLEDGGEAEAAWRRHAEFFLALAEEAEPELMGPSQVKGFERLDAEYGNIRAALSWTLEQEQAELTLRLAGVLRPYWFGRGYDGEGRRWLEEALEKAGPLSMAARVKALETLAWLADNQEDMRAAREAAEEGLRLSKRGDVEDGVLASLRGTLGDVALAREDYRRAKELFEESLTLYRKAGDRRGSAWGLGALGLLELDQGDYGRAKEFFEEVLALARELDDTLTLGACISCLGVVLMLQGDLERAAALNQEAVIVLRDRGHKGSLTRVLDNQGWVALLDGDHDRARDIFEETLVLCRELGDRFAAVLSLEALACVAAAVGEGARAAMLLGAAEALRDEGDHLPASDRALRGPYLASARSQLDGTVRYAAWAEGRAMSMDRAIEFALSEEVSAVPDLKLPEVPSLTRREREVAYLMARGLTNRQISSELVISEHTARQHVKNILKKLGLHSRDQVVSHLHDQ